MKNINYKYIGLLLIFFLISSFLSGCGGGGGNSGILPPEVIANNPSTPIQQQITPSKGTISFKICWPINKDSKVIPQDTSEINIEITGENLSETQTKTYPNTGSGYIEDSFLLPIGLKTITIKALDSNGNYLAHRVIDKMILEGANDPLNVNLGVSITDSGLFPEVMTLREGETLYWKNNLSNYNCIVRLDDLSFTSDTLKTGDDCANTFDNEGTYTYSISADESRVITGYRGTVIVGTAPKITNASPLNGNTGDTVIIQGVNFGNVQGASGAYINNIPLDIINWSSCEITANIPADGISGPIVVVVNDCASNNDFYYTANVNITNVTPLAGTYNTPLTISGNGFGATQGASEVFVNNVRVANILSWSPTEIIANIPSTTSGCVQVSVEGVTGDSSQNIAISPTITAINPVSGKTHSFITISGHCFGDTQGLVDIYNIGFTEYTSWTMDEIVCKVPNRIPAGDVTVFVTDSNGNQSNAGPFNLIRYAYVANYGGNVAVIDMRKIVSDPTNAVINVINLPGTNPQNITIDTEGNYVYVSDYNNSVPVIRTANNTLFNTINGIRQPMGSSVNPCNSKAYIASQQDNKVYIVDENNLVDDVAFGSSLKDLAFNFSGTYFYTTSWNDSKLYIYDSSNNSNVSSLILPDGVPTGYRPVGIAASTDDNYVYIAEEAYDRLIKVDVSDPENPFRAINLDLATPGYNGPQKVAISPDGDYLYVTCSHTSPNVKKLLVIRTSDLAVIDTENIPGTPYGVAVSPDNKYVLVSSLGPDRIMVYDITNQQLTGTAIPGGSQPQGIVIAP